MPRFSANISTLFTEVPLLQRIALAAQHGFAGIEVQFPYQVPAAAFKVELDREPEITIDRREVVWAEFIEVGMLGDHDLWPPVRRLLNGEAETRSEE
jgi:hypothetical protein